MQETQVLWQNLSSWSSNCYTLMERSMKASPNRAGYRGSLMSDIHVHVHMCNLVLSHHNKVVNPHTTYINVNEPSMSSTIFIAAHLIHVSLLPQLYTCMKLWLYITCTCSVHVFYVYIHVLVCSVQLCITQICSLPQYSMNMITHSS